MNGVFHNPWMLFWGLAAAIPLVLYWLRRRTVYQIEWGAMQFLYEASRGPVSRKRFRRQLLVAVRMAILLIVALVAATPVTTSPDFAAKTSAGSTRHWILVVDVSASMGSRTDQPASIEKAIGIAQSVVRESGEGDLFSLITSGVNPANQVLHCTDNREVVLQALSDIRVDAGAFRFWPVLDTIDRVIRDASEYNIAFTQMVFLSDFHAGDWPVNFREFDYLPPSIVDSSDFVTSRLIICREDDSSNIAIVNVIPERAHATIGQTVECLVELATADTQRNAWQGDLELLLDGLRVGQQTVRLEAGESSEYRFRISAERTGDLEIEARISGPGTGLELDDVRYATVKSHSVIKVLCVEGQDQASKSLVSAMSNTPSSGLPVIASSVVDISQLDSMDTQAFDLIALLAVSGLTPSQTRKLLDHTDNGRGLLISLGPNVNRDQWQAFFDTVAGSPGWVQLSREVVQGDYRLDPLKYVHPIMSAFKNHPQSGILDVPVQNYHRVELKPKDVSRVLNFDSGDPAAFVMNSGRGRILVTTTPLASHVEIDLPPWNFLPAWWSYVPLVNETVFWLFGVTDVRADVNVGEEIVWGVNELSGTGWASMTDQLSVRFPDGSMRNVNRAPGPGTSRFSTVADQPGFVRIESVSPGSDPGDSMSFAANVNPSESHQLPSWMKGLQNQLSSIKSRNNRTPVLPERPVRSSLFFTGFLILILVLLLIEPWLATRMTHRNKSRVI